MAKTLSIFLNVAKAVGLMAALSSCYLAENLEQVFPYELRIENKLVVPIAYCEELEDPSCPLHAIEGGASERLIIMSHDSSSSDQEKMEIFDRQKIKVCGKFVDFKTIRLLSPVIKREKNHFEIVIDKAVSDVFCA